MDKIAALLAITLLMSSCSSLHFGMGPPPDGMGAAVHVVAGAAPKKENFIFKHPIASTLIGLAVTGTGYAINKRGSRRSISSEAFPVGDKPSGSISDRSVCKIDLRGATLTVTGDFAPHCSENAASPDE